MTMYSFDHEVEMPTTTAPRRTLYAIGEDLLALNDLLDELEGDLSRAGEMEAALAAWLTSLESEQAEKLDSYVGLIRTLEMEEAAAKAEAEQWAQKARLRANRVAYLKRRLQEYLEGTGQRKVATATGRTISIQANGGSLPLVLADGIDLAAVPEEFVIVRREIDNEAVRNALSEGRQLEFAKLGDRGFHLRIR